MLVSMTGPELKLAIKALGCTQTALAAHAGIASEHLSRQITGSRPVSTLLPLLVREWLGPNPVNPPPRKRAKAYPPRGRP
jgi:hypothetical protein